MDLSLHYKEIVKADFYYADPKSSKSWMLCWNEKERESSTPLRGSLVLEEFDREKAIALLDKGQAVIPIWLETIHNKLDRKTTESKSNTSKA